MEPIMSTVNVSYQELLRIKGYENREAEFEVVLAQAGLNLYTVKKKGVAQELAASIPAREGFILEQGAEPQPKPQAQQGLDGGEGNTGTGEIVTVSQLCQIVKVEAGVEVDQHKIEQVVECLDLEASKIPRNMLADILDLLQWELGLSLQNRVVNQSAGLDYLVQSAQLETAKKNGGVTAFLEQVQSDRGYLEVKAQLAEARVQAIRRTETSALSILSDGLEEAKKKGEESSRAWDSSSKKQQEQAEVNLRGRQKLLRNYGF
jgi:hypothetical protein